MQIDNRLFEAKDLKRILGVTPEKVFLWLRTYHIFEPTERAISVRGKNKYSLMDLFKLGLIASLLSAGIHLSRIREIFLELDKVYDGHSLWEIVINRRKRRLDRYGIVLLVARVFDKDDALADPKNRKPAKSGYIVDIETYARALNLLKYTMRRELPVFIVNIGWIVELVETFIETHERQAKESTSTKEKGGRIIKQRHQK